MKDHPKLWQTLQVALIVSPFWLLAANVTDGDEVVKTMLAAGVAAAVNFAGKKLGIS